MPKPKRILAADLFCGAGGTSTGLLRAAELLDRRVELTAVNHWERAIETHSANHPGANHFCQSLADLDPKKAVPGGKLDLLVASPECTHHSVARGGKPVNDQSRASAYCVHRWCAALDVKRVLIENVPEFVGWGPLGKDGRPLKSKRGSLFGAFIQTFRAMGYRVEWRILNAADYGGATTRKRLFIQCVKGRLPIHWPAQTHEPDPKAGLFGILAKWRAAREIIDWKLPGESIFNRKRPLSENTLKRIEAGLKKFGGKNAEPFLALLRGTDRGQVSSSARSVDLPAPVITTSGGHVALCEPFLTTLNYTGSRDHDSRYSRSPDDPLPTVTSQGNRFGIVEPFLISFNGKPEEDCRRHDVEKPLPTQHCSNRFGLVEPFIVPANYGEREGQAPRVHDLDQPCPTVTAGGVNHAIVEPFVMHTTHHGSDRVYPTGAPLPCVTGANRGEQALIEPFTVPFYANGQADSIDEPLRTVTTRDRFGLCETQGKPRLDILFRMLQPRELAGAMGFPGDYKITGNRSEQVRQIGNAVVVEQAAALCHAMLEDAA